MRDKLFDYACKQIFDMQFEKFTFTSKDGVVYKWVGAPVPKKLCRYFLSKSKPALAKLVFNIFLQVK